MKMSALDESPVTSPVLNAVALRNAVLCADREVVSDSPNDICLVCGSRSLFNISRVFGGTLPRNRASLIADESTDPEIPELLLTFPRVA